jgi:molybdenum cofactor sulfurtransferase
MSESPIHSADRLERARADFLRRYPGYAATSAVDDLRARDYARLDRLGHTYLDYTGGGIYAESQVRWHYELLRDHVLGNPHSGNPTSLASTALVQAARASVRRFFNASAADYEVIFTANASGALKLVGESYPFGPGGVFCLTYDNHNSVNGIREFAHAKGAAITYVPVREHDLRVDEEQLQTVLRGTRPAADRLFAYPAQSNFSGVQHPLAWVDEAHELGWDVLLDCAAYAPTNPVDLEVLRPDFMPISFYKLFGYPTGVGCLIARREKLAKLRRPWFAGGTITLASVQAEDWYRLAPGAIGFEDGTLDYLGLPAVTIGFEQLAAVGVPTVHRRVSALAGWFLEEARRLHHSNGAPLIKVFGPQGMDRRGATIALYIVDPQGHPYDVYDVEQAAAAELISVRTGCFCNPGDGEVAHDITRAEMEACFADPTAAVTLMQCQRRIEDTTGKVPNTIRVSLGLASDFGDVYRFLTFAEKYRDR